MSEQLTQITGAESVVKWFSARKGFGFLIGPDGTDVFTHFSVIEGRGFRSLTAGGKVIYDAVHTSKGWKATRVVRVPAVLEVTIPRRGYSRTPRQ